MCVDERWVEIELERSTAHHGFAVAVTDRAVQIENIMLVNERYHDNIV